MGKFNNQVREDSQAFNVYADGDKQPHSPFFKVREFQTNDGSGAVLIHPALVELLDVIRREIREPLYISSGYRNNCYNNSIGGAKHSRHTYGMAADVWAVKTKPEEIAQIAEDLNVGGIGRYNSFTHVDVQGNNRRWDNRT